MFEGELLVTIVAAEVHPGLKRSSDEGIDYRTDIRPRHLADLAHDRKSVFDGRVAEAEIEDIVQVEGLILGHVDHLCVLAGDGLKKS